MSTDQVFRLLGRVEALLPLESREDRLKSNQYLRKLISSNKVGLAPKKVTTKVCRTPGCDKEFSILAKSDHCPRHTPVCCIYCDRTFVHDSYPLHHHRRRGATFGEIRNRDILVCVCPDCYELMDKNREKKHDIWAIGRKLKKNRLPAMNVFRQSLGLPALK